MQLLRSRKNRDHVNNNIATTSFAARCDLSYDNSATHRPFIHAKKLRGKSSPFFPVANSLRCENINRISEPSDKTKTFDGKWWKI